MGLDLANQPFKQKISKGAQTDINVNWIKLVFSLYHLIIRCGLKIDNVTHTRASGTGQITWRSILYLGMFTILQRVLLFLLILAICKWHHDGRCGTAHAIHYICIYECVQSTPIQKTLMTCDYGNKIIRCFIGRRTIKRWRGKKKASLSLHRQRDLSPFAF